MEYSFTSNEADELNHYVIDELKKLAGDIKIGFVTRSYYNV